MFGSLGYKVPLIARSQGVQLTDLTGLFLLSSGSFVAYQWSSVYRDDLRGFGTANNTKIIIPREGWYLITAQVFYVANTAGARGIKIVSNGSIALASSENGPNSATSATYTTLSALHYFMPNDYVEVYIYQDIGSTMQPINLYFNMAQMN